jgi:crotonobetainyl-CoA:carnitine CoA-transferase CaiB-like acyl-CoA transferase
MVTGYQGGWPQNLGGNWPDYLVGTMMAFGVMSALWHRRRTGEGQQIEVSMSELVSSFIPEAFMEYTMNGQQVDRIGNHDPNMAPHNVYRCQGDDAWVAIAARDDGEWRAICTAIGNPGLGSDPRYATLAARKRNEDELDRTVAEWTAGRSPGEVTEILQGLRVPTGPVMSVIDLMADPHFVERGYAVEMDHPEVGTRTVAGIPARFGAMPELAYYSAPLLGQHNDSVFGELLAHSPERIQQLKLAKSIY